MIYQWYSGSDTTNKVPRELSQLRSLSCDLVPKQKIDILKSLLDIENDRNWRGVIKTDIAHNLFEDKDEIKCIEFALAGIKEFDTYARNFQDVINDYGYNIYMLIARKYGSKDYPETTIEYCTLFFSIGGYGYLEEYSVNLIAGHFANALNKMFERTDLEIFSKMALSWSLKAHHSEPEDVDFLQELARCHYYLDDLDSFKKVKDDFEEVATSDNSDCAEEIEILLERLEAHRRETNSK